MAVRKPMILSDMFKVLVNVLHRLVLCVLLCVCALVRACVFLKHKELVDRWNGEEATIF
jgi:hypothetical protein